MGYRIERDSMGEIRVPADRYWAAQTQRSFENFKIGSEKMPIEVIRGLAVVKKAAAKANCDLGKLDARRMELISAACERVISGELDGHFPLAVWQTGSGTQTNMNVNEVVANLGNELAGEKLLHPNDHVNMSQSTNDAFPTAIHIAAVTAVEQRVIPEIDRLIQVFRKLEDENRDVVKSGRTHLQDATPIRFSQEVCGWRGMLESAKEMLLCGVEKLSELPLGGTAVGTGLNTPAGYDRTAVEEISRICGREYRACANKFYGLSSRDGLAFAHGALKALACNMMKLANDVRWLASGPRCGLGEISIPENEPGSSIMPGKVNPTQCEAMTMIAAQVMGNDAALGFAASQGNFELNVFMPVIAYDFIQSANLLADGIRSFNDNCACGISVNREKMRHNLHNSLMLATALNPHIGYENAAKTVKLAHAENISLRDACLRLGFMSAEDFDRVFRPEDMA